MDEISPLNVDLSNRDRLTVTAIKQSDMADKTVGPSCGGGWGAASAWLSSGECQRMPTGQTVGHGCRESHRAGPGDRSLARSDSTQPW